MLVAGSASVRSLVRRTVAERQLGRGSKNIMSSRDSAPWESRQFRVQACAGGGTDAAWRDLKLAGSPTKRERKMKRPQSWELASAGEIEPKPKTPASCWLASAGCNSNCAITDSDCRTGCQSES